MAVPRLVTVGTSMAAAHACENYNSETLVIMEGGQSTIAVLIGIIIALVLLLGYVWLILKARIEKATTLLVERATQTERSTREVASQSRATQTERSTREVASQSPVTYTSLRGVAQPRFLPLPEHSQG